MQGIYNGSAPKGLAHARALTHVQKKPPLLSGIAKNFNPKKHLMSYEINKPCGSFYLYL
jgi:hypothetical protein